MHQKELKNLSSEIEKKRRVVVITGAGASDESNIPTLRAFSIENQMSEHMFVAKLFSWFTYSWFWSWLNFLARPLFNKSFMHYVRKAEPNHFHNFISGLQSKGKEVCIITLNVDELEMRAGIPRDMVMQVHGSVWNERCLSCNNIVTKSYEGEEPDLECNMCHSKRFVPDMVMTHTVSRFDERANHWFKEDPVVIVAGLSGEVASINHVIFSKLSGKFHEINVNQTFFTDHAKNVIRMTCADAGNHLFDLLK